MDRRQGAYQIPTEAGTLPQISLPYIHEDDVSRRLMQTTYLSMPVAPRVQKICPEAGATVPDYDNISFS